MPIVPESSDLIYEDLTNWKQTVVDYSIRDLLDIEMSDTESSCLWLRSRRFKSHYGRSFSSNEISMSYATNSAESLSSSLSSSIALVLALHRGHHIELGQYLRTVLASSIDASEIHSLYIFIDRGLSGTLLQAWVR